MDSTKLRISMAQVLITGRSYAIVAHRVVCTTEKSRYCSELGNEEGKWVARRHSPTSCPGGNGAAKPPSMIEMARVAGTTPYYARYGQPTGAMDPESGVEACGELNAEIPPLRSQAHFGRDDNRESASGSCMRPAGTGRPVSS